MALVKWSLAISLFANILCGSASAGPRCDEVAKICSSAGYVDGKQAPPKKKLWADCAEPLSKGSQVEGVTLPTGFDPGSCKAEVAAEALREQKCGKLAMACKSAGYVVGGSRTAPNKALWFDCVHKIVENGKVPGVKVPAGFDMKACAAATAGVKKISYSK